MSKIKICGLTRIEEIEAVNCYMPDYVGFVFAKSKRQVDEEMAKKLKDRLNPSIQTVGVFVNETITNIISLLEQGILDKIQLHGEESEEYIRELKKTIGNRNNIIKAVRVKNSTSVKEEKNSSADYLLFDTYNKNQYGGSGQKFNWNIIASMQDSINKPFFLAGGIESNNIEQAIKFIHPYCIDVSSGAETNGFKDSEKIKELVEKIRSV